MIRSAIVLIIVTISFGCGGQQASQASVEENVAAKLEAMKKLADAADGPNAEFAVRNALEQFRNIPFDPKAHPEATAQMLETYKTRLKSKLRGDIALDVAGEMNLMESASK